MTYKGGRLGNGGGGLDLEQHIRGAGRYGCCNNLWSGETHFVSLDRWKGSDYYVGRNSSVGVVCAAELWKVTLISVARFGTRQVRLSRYSCDGIWTVGENFVLDAREDVHFGTHSYIESEKVRG